MKTYARRYSLAGLLILFAQAIPGRGQTAPPVPQQKQDQAARPQRFIDVGAEKAPLSDEQRVALDKALQAHNYPAERTVLDQAIASKPKAPELPALLGRLAFLEGHPGDAAKALAQADLMKPLAQDDRVTLAMAYAFSAQSDRAHTEMSKLMAAFPKNPEYVYLEGRIYRQHQAYESAVASFRKAIALDPKMIRAYTDLGECQEALGNLEDARKTYEEGVQINRKLAKPWDWPPLDLAALLEKDGDLPEAEKYTRESLKYNSNFTQGHYRLGMLLQKEDKNSEAVEEFQRAIAAQPGYPQPYLALGRLYSRLGKTAEAESNLRKFQQLSEAEQRARSRK